MKELTKKDKELVLIDISARLPYRVIVDYAHNAFDVHKGNYIKHGSKCILTCDLLGTFISPRQNENGEYIKPYLRSMSSMTETEKIEFNEIKRYNVFYSTKGYYTEIDWLNAHGFDYRGLIEKGLAIEAPEGMYNSKK